MRSPAFVLSLSLSLSLLCAPASLAAYVQSRACSETSSSRGGSAPSGLRASLTSSPDHHGINQLKLTIDEQQTGLVTCEQDKLSNVTSLVRVTSLGSSSIFAGLLESSNCADAGPNPQTKYAHFEFAYNISASHFLDTYWLTIELLDKNGPFSTCINAYLTPDVGQVVSQTASWAPVAIFLIVLVASLGKQLDNIAPSGDSKGSRGRQSNREPRRAHIIRIGNCISYLQFIFFAGSLTLSYPGFLRPVASKVSWSTLMFPTGLVAQKSWYDGVRDGIYEVNGTFGGTEGLELMTQVVGGTLTVSTWLNIITLAGLVFFLILALMVLGQRLTKAHHSISGSKDSFLFDSDDGFTLQAAALAALRLFCSYLLLPLVAWSTYMLTYANGIPVYYTVAATFMVTCLIGLVWLAMWRSSPHRMGYLLVDSIKKPDGTSHQSWMEDVYAMMVFVLLFLRGATIGGLQMAGLPQLSVLLFTEVFQMTLFAFSYLQNPLASQTGRMSALRTVTLLLEIGFVPGVASFSAHIILGFAVLLVHALVLVFFFLLPGVYDLYTLFTRPPPASSRQEDGDGRIAAVYTLQQIRGRPTTEQTPESTTDGSTLHMHPISPLVVYTHERTSSLSSKSRRMSYFQSSEHDSSIDLFSRTFYSEPSSCTLHTDSSASRSGIESRLNSASSHAAEHRGSSTDDSSFMPLQLDPTVDYSFREADLYYHQPRIKTFGDDKGGQDQGQDEEQTLRRSLRRMTATFTTRK
ncbi:hypothetical protein E4U21_007646 [Claviceps maximensis]|nr:hypothetical protein E4U21_007646 [Claviceps maximensis]